MQAEESINIIERFFEVLDDLVASRVLRGRGSFCAKYGIHRGNFLKFENDHTREALFKLAWLTFLTRDFGVNPGWLLTGKGKMYDKKPKPVEKFYNTPEAKPRKKYEKRVKADYTKELKTKKKRGVNIGTNPGTTSTKTK